MFIGATNIKFKNKNTSRISQTTDGNTVYTQMWIEVNISKIYIY